MSLRLGDIAPNFVAETTDGKMEKMWSCYQASKMKISRQSFQKDIPKSNLTYELLLSQIFKKTVLKGAVS